MIVYIQFSIISAKDPGFTKTKSNTLEGFYHIVKLIGEENVCYICRDSLK